MKKTFVYDTSKGFSSFIKHYYSDKMDMHICTNKKNFTNFKMKDYELCFFTVNDIEDIFLLRKVYFEIEHFFISSPKKVIFDKIKMLNYDNAIFIDSDYNKKNILDEINFNLTLKKII